MRDRDASSDTSFADLRDVGYDDGRDDEPRRGGLIAAIAFGVLLILAAILWHAYRQGVRERNAPPQVAAPAGPYKVAPQDAGGLRAPEQDLELNNQFDGGAATVAGAPAEPGGAVAMTADAGPGLGGAEEAGSPLDASATAVAEPAPGQAQPVLRSRQEVAASGSPAALPSQVQPAAGPSGSQLSGSQMSGTDASRVQASAPQPSAAQAARTPGAQSPGSQGLAPRGAGSQAAVSQGSASGFSSDAVTPVRPSGRGRFLVQVAAVRTPGEADAEWTKLVRRAPDLFAGVQKDVERADLGAKGVFYRLRAAAFSERTGATAFCEQVKTVGQDCIVVAR
jgi:hypothetical protein